jgi:hypothetical protein
MFTPRKHIGRVAGNYFFLTSSLGKGDGSVSGSNRFNYEGSASPCAMNRRIVRHTSRRKQSVERYISCPCAELKREPLDIKPAALSLYRDVAESRNCKTSQLREKENAEKVSESVKVNRMR